MKKYEKILTSILSLIIIFCGIVDNYSVNKVKAEIKDEYYKESVMAEELSINGKNVKKKNQNIPKLSDGIMFKYENLNEDEVEFSEKSEGENFKFIGNIYSNRYTSSICLIAYR